jgi:serpin B
MASAGANGRTEAEFQTLLYPELGFAENQAAWKEFSLRLRPQENEPPFRLSIASGAWVQAGFPIKAGFRELLKNMHDVRFESVDFRSDSARERALRGINDWVSARTEKRIKDLFSADALSADTRLVFANAIYFKGQWQQQFDPQQTTDRPFKVQADREVTTPTMHRDAEFAHGGIDQVHLLELPYRDCPLSFVVVLPNRVDGLAEVERTLDGPTLQRWLETLRRSRLEVSLPKLRLDWEGKLNQPLINLGLSDAFDDARADFSAITAERRLFIDFVQHQAFLEINEEGTEAAAATGLNFSLASATPTFTADHPFLFLIRDRQSGMILFMGRVANPAE